MTVQPLKMALKDLDDGKPNQAFNNDEDEKMPYLKRSAFGVSENDKDITKNSSAELRRRKRKLKYKSTIDEFAMTSTLHGLKNCYSAPSKLQRAIWVCFLCGAFSYFLYLCVHSFYTYYSYPIQTKMTIINEEKSIFPAVTLCNYNMFVRSKVKGTVYEDFLKHMNTRHDARKTSLSNMTQFNFTNTSEMYLSLSHDINEMLFSCSWHGTPCNSSNFKRTFTTMGACYTFNSGKDGHSIFHSKRPGKWFGLEMLLTVQQEEYVGVHDLESAGFKILLHDQDEPPLVDNDGFAVAPGTHTLVSVLKRKLVSLPAPYESNCGERDLRHYKVYSRSACTLYCYINYVYEKCNCFPIQLTEYVNSSRLCTPIENIKCVSEADYELQQNPDAQDCACPDPCTSTFYEPSLSYSQFPSEENLDTIAKSITRSTQNITMEAARETVRKNAVMINIFYKELNYEFTQQTPGFTGSDLLSTIGGQLGLFAGASILTVHEFVDLFFNLLAIKLGFR